MTLIIGLTGHKRSGKDTVAGALVRHHGFVRFAFADALKDVALDINPRVQTFPYGAHRDDPYEYLADIVARVGWENAKATPEVRRLLQTIGTAVRAQDPDFWVRIVVRQLSHHLNRVTRHPTTDRTTWSPAAPVVVSDVRLPNEADAIRGFGGHLVRVVRPGLALDPSALASHISETALDDHEVDFTLVNDGDLDDLAGKARALVEMASGALCH